MNLQEEILDKNLLLNYINIVSDNKDIYRSNILSLYLKKNVKNLEIKQEEDKTIYIIDKTIKLKEGALISITRIENNNSYDTYYKIGKLIYYDGLKAFKILEEELNDNAVFVVPLVINKYAYNDDYFINAYLKDEYLYIKYRFTPFNSFVTLDTRLRENTNFIEVNFSEDKRFKIYKFDIPYIFTNDIKLYCSGKFHKMTLKAKQKIIKFHEFKENDYFYKVLFNDVDMIKLVENALGINLPEDMNFRSKPQNIYYE